VCFGINSWRKKLEGMAYAIFFGKLRKTIGKTGKNGGI
jgi:hypothetical protein